MALPAPWGAYIANYSDVTKLYDYTGNRRHATISGSRPVLNTQTGDGATASIPSLTGSTSTKIIWPPGSIPTEFTICSITRYAGSAQQRILAGILTSTTNWLHGHHYRKSGVAYYNTWMTQYPRSSSNANSELTNWLVMCGTNNMILVNGVVETRNAAGSGNDTLTINGFGSEESDFGFQQVIIWNTKLSEDQMKAVSTLLTNYLTTGNITGYPWYSQANFSLIPIPRQSNYYKTTNSIQTSIYPTLELPQAIIKIVTDNSLNGVSNPYKSNDSYIFSSILDTSYTPDFTGINEKPNTVGYSVGGTDVSTWSIASYVDINTFPTFSSDKIPSWCKAIRVIMIGGGGSKAQDFNQGPFYKHYAHTPSVAIIGASNTEVPGSDPNNSSYNEPVDRKNDTIQQFQNQNVYSVNQDLVMVFIRHWQQDNPSRHYNTRYNWEFHNHQGVEVDQYGIHQTGGGGGGGGAVYISSISTQTYSQIQISGTSSLTLSLNGATIITCGAGGNGGAQTGGIGGTVSTPVGGFTPTFSNNGTSGDRYGNNGNNGFRSDVYSTTLNVGNGGSGTGPYYRVYFLTN